MGAIKNAMMDAGYKLRAQYRAIGEVERAYPWPAGVADDLYDARMTLAHAIAAACPFGQPAVCLEWFEHCADDRCHDEGLDRCACGHYRFQHTETDGARLCTATGSAGSSWCGRCATDTDWNRWSGWERVPVDAPAVIR